VCARVSLGLVCFSPRLPYHLPPPLAPPAFPPSFSPHAYVLTGLDARAQAIILPKPTIFSSLAPSEMASILYKLRIISAPLTDRRARHNIATDGALSMEHACAFWIHGLPVWCQDGWGGESMCVCMRTCVLCAHAYAPRHQCKCKCVSFATLSCLRVCST